MPHSKMLSLVLHLCHNATKSCRSSQRCHITQMCFAWTCYCQQEENWTLWCFLSLGNCCFFSLWHMKRSLLIGVINPAGLQRCPDLLVFKEQIIIMSIVNCVSPGCIRPSVLLTSNSFLLSVVESKKKKRTAWARTTSDKWRYLR